MKEHIDFTKGYVMTHIGQSDNLTSDELKSLEAVAQICDAHLFDNLAIKSGLQAHEIVPLLRSITVSLNETTLFCKWRNSINSCSEFFTEILTEEGFCYTFNVLDSSELYRDNV
jgi:amiloride-sensitive sodium channel